MALLFHLNRSGSVVLHPQVASLVDELRFLKEDELLFVILAVDYFSPFHQFPDEERLRKAKLKVYGDQDIAPWGKAHVKKAMSAYLACQYDIRQEQKKMYQRKTMVISEEIEVTNDSSKLKALMATMKDIRAAIKSIDEEIEGDIEQNAIEGGGQTSFIEQVMTNIKQYKQVIAKRKEVAKKKKKDKDDDDL